MVSKSTEQRRKEDAQSTAEMLAEYEAKYGRKAAEVIARSLGEPLPPRKRAQNAKRAQTVGVRAKARPAITAQFVEGSRIPKATPWNERDKDKGVRIVRVKVVATYGKAVSWKCRACGRPLGDGEHVQVSGRTGMQIERFHGGCLPEDARNGIIETDG